MMAFIQQNAAVLIVAAAALLFGFVYMSRQANRLSGDDRQSLEGAPRTMTQMAPRRSPAAQPAATAARPVGAEDAIRDALARGEKITAIKLMREATGMGLAEAKDAVEAMMGGAAPPARLGSPTGAPSAAGLSPAAEGAVRDALRAGNKIQAIKLLRDATGLGLAEAKAAVEAMER